MLDLRSLRLDPGDVRHEHPTVRIDPLVLGGQTYDVVPAEQEVDLEVQAAAGGLYLRLRFAAHVEGPCYRCIEPATAEVTVDASDYHAASPPEHDDELVSDYVSNLQLDVERWVRDSLIFALPDKILCRDDCIGLCPRCGERLEADVEHACGEEEPDARWAKLRDLL
jgi:DUF177 domain-containing protein